MFKSLFDWFRGRASAGRDPADDRWWNPIFSSLSAAGVNVTPESALTVPAVVDCLRVLTEPITTLPLVLYRRTPTGRERILDHPVLRVLRVRPNALQTPFEFRAVMQWNLAFHRNAFAEMRTGPAGEILELVPLDPMRVQIEQDAAGDVRYRYQAPDNSERVFLPGELMHLKAPPFTSDGIAGVPVYQFGRDAIGYALAVQHYGSRWFKNSGISGGVIEAAFTDDAARRAFMQAWRESRTGDNAHRDAILPPGAKYHPIRINNEDAQFIEARKEAAYDIARLFRVQPHKIGLLDRATFSNIEQQSIEFVTDTLLPWLTLWEQAIERDLLLERERGEIGVHFNVAGLLRGDIHSRFKAYAIARQWGWMSVNEIRELEDMNPVEGGDSYLVPLNMADAAEPEDEKQPEQQRAALKLIGDAG